MCSVSNVEGGWFSSGEKIAGDYVLVRGRDVNAWVRGVPSLRQKQRGCKDGTPKLLHGVGDVCPVEDVVVPVEVQNRNCVRAGREVVVLIDVGA